VLRASASANTHPELALGSINQGLQDQAISQLVEGEGLPGHDVVGEDLSQRSLRRGGHNSMRHEECTGGCRPREHAGERP
jgi:hypothetical protein